VAALLLEGKALGATAEARKQVEMGLHHTLVASELETAEPHQRPENRVRVEEKKFWNHCTTAEDRKQYLKMGLHGHYWSKEPCMSTTVA
jgi:hypothetical protein